jgi:hypothetical protein
MKYLLAFLAALALGYAGARYAPAEAVSPPDSHQQNPDVYSCCSLPSVFAGWTPGDLSTLNPLTVKLRGGTRTITYSYVVVPGCSDGNMQDNLAAMLTRTSQLTGVTFVKVSGPADVNVRATCGVDAANVGVTGGVVGDLYPGWPYQANVNVNTIMATYPSITQQSIWAHEFVGHGLGTWHEQYQLDGTFTPTPGLVDFMNTGPDSRILWPQNDIDRWSRTVYDITPPQTDCAYLGYDPCSGRWRFVDQLGQPTAYDPATGIWYLFDQPEWLPCNADRIRWNLRLQEYANTPGAGTYKPGSYWTFMPAC